MRERESITWQTWFKINSELNWNQVAIIHSCSQHSTGITNICNDNNVSLAKHQSENYMQLLIEVG